MSPVTVEIGEDVIYQPLQNEVVLLNLTSQEYFGLNQVGTMIWNLLADKQNPESIVAHICEDYNVDLEIARRDVEQLIAKLVKTGLVKPVVVLD